MYMHGYTEGSEVQSVHVSIEAFLKRREHNIILLEWSELASGNYFVDAVPNADMIGILAADRLLKMFKNGLDVEKFHLLGHSVGGQAIGKIGREVIALSNGKVKLPRITSLDPAFPKYYRDLHITPISYRDAEFVDIIHTDSWLYGSPLSAGTVDFWPNGGKSLQPGCPRRQYKQLTQNDLCSHRRSWILYAESVIDEVPKKFLAVKAKSWDDFKKGRTEPLESYAVMGYNCPTNLTGNYYLQTNEASPYARGEDGTKYTKVKPKPRDWFK
ncbi:unnamed protein product [Hermetia illucens]|uniref:Lipase domain-containing protein n=2 Tax=Hermetia illucens TaxID=343691 RepID=A0A7R8YPF1_HERIL|nr:unnamed protein product [Hermetia illucens]